MKRERAVFISNLKKTGMNLSPAGRHGTHRHGNGPCPTPPPITTFSLLSFLLTSRSHPSSEGDDTGVTAVVSDSAALDVEYSAQSVHQTFMVHPSLTGYLPWYYSKNILPVEEQWKGYTVKLYVQMKLSNTNGSQGSVPLLGAICWQDLGPLVHLEQ